MTTANGYEPEDHERVPHTCRCQQCGEDRMDRLVWVDDDHVRCATCGTVYNPDPGETID